ncbi:unnamed protein product [Trifolium pratense]|uniref:Uncharacterized protein n=1 Tax=Trifolium pratense TaxID=57577 RepID=A0ACB0L179_TRIPR|nr:unnamed protein product [Trifolium pratense]
MLGRTILLTYKHKTHAVDSVGNVISNADVNYLLILHCWKAASQWFVYVGGMS